MPNNTKISVQILKDALNGLMSKVREIKKQELEIISESNKKKDAKVIESVHEKLEDLYKKK